MAKGFGACAVTLEVGCLALACLRNREGENLQTCTIPVGGTRNASVTFITLSQFERQLNGNRLLWSTSLAALVNHTFNAP
jgi:hypothetical protein